MNFANNAYKTSPNTVLDAFDNRIGSRTCQTVITEDGLQAVKKLLRKTASKNTAVFCHWIRSRSCSDLLWVVGNQDKFNSQGIVPYNKDGIVGGRQRYHCKSCSYRHTVAYKWYREDVKRQALAMYLEGLGFRSIGRLLGCSHVTVYQWIKQSGEKARLDELPSTELEVVEMDERHSYVGSKNRWLALDCR